MYKIPWYKELPLKVVGKIASNNLKPKKPKLLIKNIGPKKNIRPNPNPTPKSIKYFFALAINLRFDVNFKQQHLLILMKYLSFS